MLAIRLAVTTAILLAMASPILAAEPLVEYEIDAVSNSETQSPLAPTHRNGSEATLSASPLELVGVGFRDVGGTGDYFGSHWRTEGSFNGVNEYYEFSVSGLDGNRWQPSQLAYSLVQYHYSGFLGPAYWGVHASTDGFESVDVSLAVDQDPAHLIGHDRHFLRTVSDFSALGPGPFEELTFRIYGWNSSHTVGIGGLANSASYADPGSNLVVEGTVQAPACGNGLLEGFEECDDGNTLDGDCCSSTCEGETSATSVQSYRIEGAPTGTPWSWEIRRAPGSDSISVLSVPGVLGTTSELADAFASSIDAAAAAQGWISCEVAAHARETSGNSYLDLIVGHGSSAILGVGGEGGPPDDCVVMDPACTPFEPCACAFNPTIVMTVPEPGAPLLLISGALALAFLHGCHRRSGRRRVSPVAPQGRQGDG